MTKVGILLERNVEAVEKLLARFRAMDVGQVVAHTELVDLIGLRWTLPTGEPHARDRGRYYQITRLARKRYTEETGGIELLTVPGTGFRYPTGDEQICGGLRTVRRGTRSIARGTRSVANTKTERIESNSLRKNRDHLLENLRQIEEMTKLRQKLLTAEAR